MAIKVNTTKNTQPQTASQPTSINEVVPYDIVTDRQNYAAQLANSKEIDTLTSTIDISDLNTIVTYGGEAANEISKASDIVLKNANMEQLDKPSAMMNTLAKIMSKFDIEEVNSNPKGLQKLFGNVKKKIDKIIEKYNTLGDEVDKIYVQLKQYEVEIQHSSRNLNQLFDANVSHYHELVKYIVAGEQACTEIKNYISERETELQTTGDSSIQFEIQSAQQALLMLEQRVQDLRTAENVAIQSVPMIKTMEYTNMNLVRKINSAFIITLPVFKQALAQAILLKRQKIQADAMAALDQKTNEMLIKNAQNSVEQMKMTTQLTTGSSIKAETLETTWKTIMGGIEEVRKINDDAKAKLIQDRAALENIKESVINFRY